MPLSDVVDVQITAQTSALTLPGFGTPLILGAVNKTYPERVRYYSDVQSLADDFPAGTPEYAAASAIFAQNPHPDRIAVGRRALKPTQSWTVTPVTTIQAIQKYAITIGDTEYEFTSDATPSAAEVVTGLTPLINADTGTHGLTASGTSTLKLTGAAGAWQHVAAGDVNLLRVVQDGLDPGVTTDLDAILLEGGDWYAIVNPWNSTAEILAIAAWTEAHEKLFVAQSQETQIIDTADGTASDVAHQVKALAYKRTSVWYDPDGGTFLDAAILGLMLPAQPGSETWALKTLAGVEGRKYTGTNLNNLRAKNANWVYTLAGRNITENGMVADAEFIDTIRFLDWLKVDMQSRVFTTLTNAKKIPYTDGGATIILGQILASLEAGVTAGGLAPGSTDADALPVAQQNPNDRAARYMPGFTFTGVLAGAIHKVQIRGTVTV